MNALELIGKRQASWSTTANALKSSLDRVRWSTFALAVAGAILATVASQLMDPDTRRWVAMAGAIVLGVGTFLTARLASVIQVGGWVRARAASEALKREAYKFAARAAPYDGADAEQALARERDRVESGNGDLTGRLIEVDKIDGTPASPMSADDYIAKRVTSAIDWYRKKADGFREVAARLRVAEFALALASTIITAAVGVMTKYPIPDFKFDFAALTAVLTTIGALILAHIEASRYDFLVTTYRATARRLEDALQDPNAKSTVPSTQWSAFVERCESIIAAENNSWVAKWTGSGK